MLATQYPVSFQENLSIFLGKTIKSMNEELKLKRADLIRHTVSAKEQWRTVRSHDIYMGSMVT